jgi:hypothetical protein
MHDAVPLAPEQPLPKVVYLVLCDFGKLGRAYVETDPNYCDETDVIRFMIDGEFVCPLQVVAFNLAEGWSRDVSFDIAAAVMEQARKPLAVAVHAFIERQLGRDVDWDSVSLRL